MSDEAPQPVPCINILLEGDYTLTVRWFELDDLKELAPTGKATMTWFDMDGHECLVWLDRVITMTQGWVVNLGYPQGWVPTVRSGSLEGDEPNG